MKNNRFVAASLTPIFLFLFVFSFLPLLLGLGISFFDYNPLNDVQPFVGLENISRLFSDEVFLIAFKNTLVFVFITVTLNVVITLILAQLISSLKHSWMRGFLRVVFFMPCVAPLVASSVVWHGLYATKYGLINNILGQLFGMAPKNWLGDPATLLPAIIIVTLWADIGYNIIIFSAGIDNIPADFYEAATIDGASKTKSFLHITLPLLGRTFSFVLAMTLISHFQMFAQFQMLSRSSGGLGGPNNSAMVLTLYTWWNAFEQNQMGYASATALALFLVIMIFTALQQWLNRVDWGY